MTTESTPQFGYATDRNGRRITDPGEFRRPGEEEWRTITAIDLGTGDRAGRETRGAEGAHVELPCTCPILTMRKGWIDFGCRGDGQAWTTSPTCEAHGADYRPCKPGCRCRLHAAEEAGAT